MLESSSSAVIDEQTSLRERRTNQRHQRTLLATVFRDSDKLRVGFRTKVESLSVGGLGVTAPFAMEVGEMVKIKLENRVQRHSKEFRGQVRWQQAGGKGEFQIGIELMQRMTPLDLQVFKWTGIAELPVGQNRWV